MTTDGLGASASRGAAITAGGQVARVLIQLVSLIVLARLLSPEDFGLVAMVTAIVGIGEVFRDFGLSSAAIQAASISNEQRSNLFWINTLIGVGLAAVTVLAAPLAVMLYGDPAVGPVMQVISVTFVINGLATQYRADLNRNLRFGVLAVYDTAAQVLSVSAAIVIAALGAGYWSLVTMNVAQTATGLIFVVAITRWIPNWYRRGVPMAGFFKFGVGVAGSQLLGYASKNVDSVILGATLGASVVGFYNRAYQVLMLPLNQLQAPSTRVALPVLSRLHADQVRYDAFLIRGQTILLHAVGFVLAFSAAQAVPLFEVVLGPQWTASVPIFQALAVGGLASMANYACYWVFLSKGLTGSHFWFSLVTRPLMIGGIVAGAFVAGAMGVAAAYSVVSLALWPATLWWLSRISDAPVARLFTNGLRALLVYGAAGALSWAVTSSLGSLNEWIILAIGLLGFVAALAVGAVFIPAYRRDVQAVMDTRRFFRGGQQ